MRSKLAYSRRNALTAAFLLSCVAPCALAEEKEVQSSLGRLAEQSTPDNGELLDAVKSLVPPSARGEIAEKPGQPSVLYGDLFGDRKSYAVVALSNALGFAAWDGKQWQSRGFWKVDSSSSLGEKPIEAIELSGDRVKEILFSEVTETGTPQFHLFFFNKKTGALEPRATSVSKPVFERGYLQIQPTEREVAFLRWTKGNLVSVASWRQEQDDAAWTAIVHDSRGLKEDEFAITSTPSDASNESAYRVLRNGKPFSEVVIRWKEKRDDAIALGFLFERLTWIPRSLYPGADKETPATVTLERLAELVVTGNPLRR